MSIINTPFCSICETSKNCVWKPSTKYFINSLIFILPRYFFLQQSAILHFWDHIYCDHQGLATDRSSANTPPRKQIKIRKYRQSQGIFNATPRKWNEMKYAFLFFMIPSLSLRLRNLYNWACRTWIMPFWYLRLCQFILNFFCSKFAALH